MNKNRIFISLLFFSTALFVVYLLLLSYHSRLCSDDLYFLSNYMEKGWFSSVAEFPFNIRWSSYLLFNSIFIFNHDFQMLHWNIFIYDTLAFSLLIFSVYSLCNVLFKKIFDVHLPSFYVLLTSLIFIISLYFSTSQPIEVWFWTVASTTYLFPIIFFGFGLSKIISDKKSVFNYIVIVFSFVFMGGASENFALIFIFLILLFLFIFYFSKKYKSIPVAKLWIALISLGFLFIIKLFSSGFANRLSLENNNHDFYFNLNWEHLINVFVQIKTLVFGFYLCIAFVIGNLIRGMNFMVPPFKIHKAILYNLLFLFVIAVLTFFPLIYVFHNLGPERAWVPFNLFICISLFAWSFYLGNRFKINTKIFSVTKYIIALGSIFIMSFYIFRHYPVVSAFSEKYDARIETLLQLKNNGNTEPVYLDPLPDSGPLVCQELNNTDFRTNKGLEKALTLNFKIYLKSNLNEK